VITKAQKLADIRNALRPKPLQITELQEFFQETGEARDPFRDRRKMIAGRLNEEGGNNKILFFGHPGSGKSTELVKLQDELRDRYVFVSFSLIDEAQLSQSSIEAILVLVVETLARAAEKMEVTLGEKALKDVYKWFSEAFDIKEEDIRMGLEAGAKASVGGSLLGKLLGLSTFLKSDIRAGSHTIHKSITKENKRLAELVNVCNLLVKEVKLGIREKMQRELVLVVEDMDKLPLEGATEILIQNPAPLKDLACKAIYTAPIWILCNPRSVQLEALFDKITLPMIKVTNREDGTQNDEGRAIIRDILEKRMDTTRLIDGGAEGEALTLAIEKTGGVLRHLFDVLITAAEAAETAVGRKKREAKKITEDDIRYGLDQLKTDLVRRLGVIGLPEEYKDITTQALRERLKNLAQNPRKLDSDSINLLLLQAHAIIEYNGEGWHAVHPLMAEYIQEEGNTQEKR